MSKFEEKIAELEQVISNLKVRAFDAQEVANSHAQSAEGFKGVILKIASMLGLEASDQLTTDHVVDKVAEVVASVPTPEVAADPVADPEAESEKAE